MHSQCQFHQSAMIVLKSAWWLTNLSFADLSIGSLGTQCLFVFIDVTYA